MHVELKEDHKKIPTIHWIPKIHKNPYKSRFIVNSISSSTKQVSVMLTSCLTSIKSHVKKYSNKVYENSGINLFWSINNSLDVVECIEGRRFIVSTINTYDFSTLYTSIPQHLLIKKLIPLIEKTFAREKTTYIAINDRKSFFTNEYLDKYTMWTCVDVCEALKFVLDNSFLKFGKQLYKQTIGIPMGANYAPLIADLFLYCYESEYMLRISKSGNSALVDHFNNSFRYIDDILSMDNPLFTKEMSSIYPSELQLNKSNTSNKQASFLDLQLEITENKMNIKVYDKRDDFNFKIINYPSLDGDVPASPSYGVFISQLIRFARICTEVNEFCSRSRLMSEKLLKQGFKYQRLRKTFCKFFNSHNHIVSKYECSLKSMVVGSVAHPEFYGDVLKKIRKVKMLPLDNCLVQLKVLLNTYIKRGYKGNILYLTCLLVFPDDFLKMNSMLGLCAFQN